MREAFPCLRYEAHARSILFMLDDWSGVLGGFYSVAHTVHTAWNAGGSPKSAPGGLHTARFLNLPCPETYAVLISTWPQLHALEHEAGAHIPEGLVEQWNRHHSLLRGTWERLHGSQFKVETRTEVHECLDYLREAGVRPRFWRSNDVGLAKLLGQRYEAFRCLFDCVCIHPGKADAPVHLNGFGMPCSEQEAAELPVLLVCTGSPAQSDMSNEHRSFRGGNT